ncbi:MAG: 4-(cytidine 5'-diphospho)-2-C-methyl-D-erythritol kinase [Candidatus Omnitrophica bacterium]|nr:4-(cytidine 5'-diphospho)-2-C-methyl-D-erythritol kinase [Candidatus Omnitrophota bacterium]MDD5352875.1 4-(cytidine 5'-diphospho)-2-C-methyl-D-erythritol kinase [Candidatus Omnitrophota bacterium]MDD5550474.1 4-(cytidine 5'-diphospho)-2-C-methyl-D-erythritol kinase [Candidatus Omnitrophota bacterium]
MKQVKVLAPAKINLFLKILNKREDGYHNIETVFEKISLFDKVILKDIPTDKVVIESNCKDILLAQKNNTVYKAICLIKNKFRIKRGLYVYIEKNIPIAAGLGGGSSDAAATIKGLNKLWNLGLSKKELLNLSRGIGSDVPLFMAEGSFLLGSERGNKVSKISKTDNLKLWHILIASGIKVSTPYAYSLFDKHYVRGEGEFRGSSLSKRLRLTIPPYGANIVTCALLKRDVSLLNYYSYNSFENLVIKQFPKLARLKGVLEDIAHDFVHMSGSGSALFMTFSNRKGAEYLIRKMRGLPKVCRYFLVSTL